MFSCSAKKTTDVQYVLTACEAFLDQVSVTHARFAHAVSQNPQKREKRPGFTVVFKESLGREMNQLPLDVTLQTTPKYKMGFKNIVLFATEFL